jgi:hypothetical protein
MNELEPEPCTSTKVGAERGRDEVFPFTGRAPDRLPCVRVPVAGPPPEELVPTGA